jgi:hypothetical protein
MPKVYTHPTGENSPNLVTLILINPKIKIHNHFFGRKSAFKNENVLDGIPGGVRSHEP